MKWIKDVTGNYICSQCGNMVPDNGYGDCDYEFCPHCGEPVQEEKHENKELH